MSAHGDAVLPPPSLRSAPAPPYIRALAGSLGGGVEAMCLQPIDVSSTVDYMASSWSQLPPEILDLILQRLPLPDCFTFGKVCPSWRSVFLQRRGITRPPPCMLLEPYFLTEDTMQLYVLHGARLHKFRSPVLNLHAKERIVCSSMGWLVIVYFPYVSLKPTRNWQYLPSLHMLNPISNERIPLPSFDGTIYHVVISAAPMSGDCVLVLTGCVNDFTMCFNWCRPGDSEWTVMEDGLGLLEGYGGGPGDTMFHNGKLYLVGGLGDFHIFDFVPQPKKICKGSFAGISGWEHWYKMHMLHFGADLFLVGWPRHNSLGRVGYASLQYANVNSLDKDAYVVEVFKQSADTTRWVRVQNLGGQVLLIDESAQSFSTQDLLGSSFEPNCIYFRQLSDILVKFSVESGSSEMFHIPVSEAHFYWIAHEQWMTLGPSSDRILHRRPLFWMAPPQDFVKVNFDAGSSKDSATYGIVVRNHLGHVSVCKFGRCSAADPLYANGSTLLFGIELALLLNFSKVVFECNDEHLIALLMFDEAQPPQNVIEIIKSCKKLAAKFEDCSFDYIRREGNEAARGLNLLARSDKWAYADTDVTCLLAPDEISDVICAELANLFIEPAPEIWKEMEDPYTIIEEGRNMSTSFHG